MRYKKINRIAELHNGIRIPTLGYRIDHDNLSLIAPNVKAALDAGLRHFDLPADPEAEAIAAKVLMESDVPRYELFLCAKLGNDDHGYMKAMDAFERTLKRIGTDYVDLYLIDWPNPLKFRDQYFSISHETWRALETIYKTGKAHAIGIGNFEERHIEHILAHCDIAPMVNQARIYPGFPFWDNFNCAEKHAIQTEGFLPPFHEQILVLPALVTLGEKYKVTSRTICAAYLFNKNCIALCQGNESDIAELSKAYDITLSEEELNMLDNIRNAGPANIDPDTCDF